MSSAAEEITEAAPPNATSEAPTDVPITEIIMAAVVAEGAVGDDPQQWLDRVTRAARLITVQVASGSTVSKAIIGMRSARTFITTILDVTAEEKTKRGQVSIKTKPSKWFPDGIELIRTEQWSTMEGAEMIKMARGLIGHRVKIWIEVNPYKVLRHIEDLGDAKSEKG